MHQDVPEHRISIEEADKVAATYDYMYMIDPTTVKTFVSKEQFIALVYNQPWASRIWGGISVGCRFLSKISNKIER